jgi:FixJ family two-component response regulator
LKTIVVVDDDAGMRMALETLFGAAGFCALAYDSAEDLLEAGAAVGAACFVLDVQLPGLSGFGLRRRLAELHTRAPVIFITAHDAPAARAEAASLGAVAYLTKPFAGRRLVEAVREAVGPS